jgi:hypothetical protein
MKADSDAVHEHSHPAPCQSGNDRSRHPERLAISLRVGPEEHEKVGGVSDRSPECRPHTRNAGQEFARRIPTTAKDDRHSSSGGHNAPRGRKLLFRKRCVQIAVLRSGRHHLNFSLFKFATLLTPSSMRERPRFSWHRNCGFRVSSL